MTSWRVCSCWPWRRLAEELEAAASVALDDELVASPLAGRVVSAALEDDDATAPDRALAPLLFAGADIF
jgi:hypothetical protein